jgi:hypothetical protein
VKAFDGEVIAFGDGELNAFDGEINLLDGEI